MQLIQKMPNNKEKVLVIGNRLANLNTYRKSEQLEQMNHSHEALETLLQPNLNQVNSIKKNQHSSHSLHVDSAVSISGLSQQSTPPVASSPIPSLPPPAPVVLKDEAQMVDFVSSFLFPITFIVFNIVYWMVYLNMHIESDN